MDSNPLYLSHDPLLNVPIDEINQPAPTKRYKIIIIGLCLVVFLLSIALSLVFVATRKQQSSSITTNTILDNCFATSWNPVGETLVKVDRVSTLAVDNDFNIYTSDVSVRALQKWLPGADKPINLFEGHFPETPIFYHSLTHSLYFFIVFKDTPGVYKLVDGNSTPVNVFSSNGRGWNIDQLDSSCKGLYVNTAGDVFVLDEGRRRIVKWMVNATSGVLVAGRKQDESNSDQLPSPSGLYVDEIDNSIYALIDSSGRQIKRFSNGSVYGVTIFGGGPSTVLSDLVSDYIEPQSMIVDKMGSENCAATRWNPVGKKLVKIEHASSLAVDNDFNVYVANWDTHTLQKWSPGTNELINLFEEQFPETPIFYHSLTRSLYFFYVYKDIPGVFKLVNGNSAPVNVFSSNGRGWNLDQLDSSCKGLYVNAAGDIFVLDQGRHRIVKWVVNATSGVLVAGRKEDESNSDQLEFPSGLYVDEINNSVYVITDMMGRRIKRFSNGSVYGVSVFGGGPSKYLSEIKSEYVEPLSMIVDKMGNILVGENSKITRWTSDIKYNGIILGESLGGGATHFYTPQLMTFDKLGNLYVYDKSDGQVIRFDVNSTSCINNLH
ncbi:unnamed protein product [Adineta steineri]|uniref:NHL repeat-containing protein n=1 Tax=Adineta steineri TaxID=433720 RepID=A0A818RIQ6_9BILA|nr:unnamed protein product [Adineta steineri]